MKKNIVTICSFALAIFAMASTAHADGDAAAGEKLFKKKCKACHTVEVGGANKVGPNLAGFISRGPGKADYNYSKGLKAAEFAWSDEKLDEWLTNPKKMVKGAKMVLKLKKEKERADVIAYLKTIGQ